MRDGLKAPEDTPTLFTASLSTRSEAAGMLDDIRTGDRRVALEALRDHLIETLKIAEPPTVAALVKQLQSVLGELDAVTAPAEVPLVDQLAARRADRIANTETPPEAGKRSQQRRSGSR